MGGRYLNRLSPRCRDRRGDKFVMRVRVNLEDWRREARQRLPAPIYNYLDGGADDELTLRRNRAAFQEYELLPRVLVDVGTVSLATRVLGCDLELPLMLAATGMSRLFHADREFGVARAAAAAGALYSLSTMATARLEDVAAVGQGPRLFQIYLFRDRGLTRELIERCRAAGYDALALTVDTPLAGNRERDRRTGMTIPPAFGWRSWLSFATHPRWSLSYLADRRFELENVVDRVNALRGGPMGVIEYVNAQFDRTATWDDAEWLIREWAGPVALKGVLHPDDVRRAATIGARAVILSNHGGRQLDTIPAAIDCVSPARDAVGDALELIVEGGIRRGTDVLKALALGANAAAIGRPYLSGLAAAGMAGVTGVLSMFRQEIERDLALLGCRSVAEVGPHVLRQTEVPKAGMDRGRAPQCARDAGAAAGP